MKTSEAWKIVKQSLLLRSMPEAVSEKFLTEATIRKFSRGETVFLQGEAAKAIFIVLDGWVKLHRFSQNGNEVVVNVFTRGHSFGEAVAFRELPYPVSAEAVTDCTLLMIPTHGLRAVLEQEPDLAMAILASTFQHLHELVGQIEQIKSQTGAQRVADFLIKLSDHDSGKCVVTLPYDKVLIAGRLGMKPESLSRAFAKLKKFGVHVSRHHAKIDDIQALYEFVEKDPADAWSKTQ